MENYDNYDNYEEYRNSPSKDESFQEYGELVSVKIIEYYYVSDGNSYDQHYYVIRVDIDGMSFTIDRSYIDFVELHRLLIKKYPKTMLLKLPLAAYTEIERKLSGLKRKKSSGNIMSIDPIQTTKKSFIATRDSFLSVRENFLIGGSKDYLINPYKYEESISDKKDELDEYLQLLMIQSELITSEEFLLFLDEEYKSMHDTDPKEPLSIHDILLLNQTENKCVVNRTEDYYISLTPQQMLLWRFRTLAYDIGFSVEINGEQKVPYTRYSAHQAPICGSVEPVATNSVCLLKWDNSYSKLRSKHLIWTVRVVTPEEYHLAKTQALECQREKKKFELQRFTTKRVGIKMASKLSGGIIHGSSVLPDAAEEEISILRDLEQEVDRLTTENEDLKKQCEEEQLQKESVQQSLDALSESWNFSVLQAEQAKSENKQLKELLLSTEKLISDKDSELDKLKKQVSVLTKQLMLGSSRESKLLEICEKNNKKLQNSNKLLHEKIMENHTMLSEIRKEANHFIVKTLQGNNSNGDLHTEDLILINSKKLVTVESSSLIDVIESRDHSMHKLHELAEDMVGELEEAQRFIRNNCDFMTDVAKRLKENADQLAINPK